MNVNIEGIDTYVVLGILVFFGGLEALTGHLKQSKRKSGDWLLESIRFVLLSVFIKPAIVLLVLFISAIIFPHQTAIVGSWHLAVSTLFYLLIDDFLQYWYHRLAHENPGLWKLHRPHHQAEEMGFFVSYRNAALYYVFMPNIWWIGIFAFLGGSKAIAIGLILKQLVIISSHSKLKWDTILYRQKILNPISWVLEHIIVTPAFHYAHHGKSMKDGVSDPNGNFGNMFSLWDQLFGTAKFTRKFPSSLGLQREVNDKWTAQLLYPIVLSEDINSEISKNYEKNNTTELEPIELHLDKGKYYLWCQCGMSKNQPFCDGHHHGTKIKPLLFKVNKSGLKKLCNCKLTKAGPFCDNSHLNQANNGEQNSGNI